MDTFNFNNDQYEYFHNPYNATITNERAVEVPIVLKLLKLYEGEFIDEKQIKFQQMDCLKRISDDNKWIEVEW